MLSGAEQSQRLREDMGQKGSISYPHEREAEMTEPGATVSRQELAERLVGWVGLGSRLAGDVATVVHRLGAVQIDPMQVVAPAHLWTLSLRRGATPLAAVDRALAAGRMVEAYCHARCFVHVDDGPALVAGWRRRRRANHLARYGVEEAAAHVLAYAESGAAFTARALDTGRRVTGFWDAESVRRTKATSVAVDLLWAEGRLAVVGRQGGQKLYRLLADHLPHLDRLLADMSDSDALEAAVRHSLRTWGVLGSATHVGWGAVAGSGRAILQEARKNGWVVPVRLSGEEGEWWVVPELLDLPPPTPRRTVLLAPVDNLLWDRTRLFRLFHFPYRWQAYTPTRVRQGGAYNMPVLKGAAFVGEADARWAGSFLTVDWRLSADVAETTLQRAARRADALCGALRGRSSSDGGLS
jgi:uncharacterized protein YcaQ